MDLPLSSGDTTLVRDSAEMPVVIVTGPGGTYATDLLVAALASERPDDDVLTASPAAARWSADELVEQVITPAAYVADVRRHIVIDEADRAAGNLHDKLLKTLEDANPGVTFWLNAADESALPPTLRGRAARTVTLAGPDQETALAHLAALGAADPERLLTLAGGDLILATATTRFNMEEILHEAAAPAFGAHPHRRAGAILLALAHLAVALGHKTKKTPAVPAAKGTAPLPDLSKLRPEQRVRFRKLIEKTLLRWEAEVLDQLRHHAANPGRVSEQLAALDAARRGMARNAPLVPLVAGTLVRLNAPAEPGR